MKKILLFICLCIAASKGFTQEKVDQFCQVLIVEKLLSKKVNIDIDFGERRKLFERNMIKDEMDKIKSFNTTVDALNYMGRLGWKLVLIAPPTSTSNAYVYTFKKEFDKSEVDKSDQASK